MVPLDRARRVGKWKKNKILIFDNWTDLWSLSVLQRSSCTISEFEKGVEMGEGSGAGKVYVNLRETSSQLKSV